MPEISVIVPNYHTAHEVLISCLRSILNQTFEDFELILIDDGSSKEYRAIYREIEKMDKRIRLIFTENGGVSSARNIGLKEATGQYVLFSDADDLLINTFFEEAVAVATRYDADMVFGCNMHLQDYRPDTPQRPLEDTHVVTLYDEKISDLKAHLVGKRLRFENGRIYIGRGPWTRLVKRDIAKAVTFDERLKVCEDIQWNLEVLGHCKMVCYVKRAWYLYNMHESSYTRRHNADAFKQAEEGLEVVRNLLDFEKDDQYKAFCDRLVEDMTRLHSNCLSGAYKNVKSDRHKIYTTYPWKMVTEKRYRQMVDNQTKIKITLYRMQLLMMLFDIKAALKCMKNRHVSK